jgi:EAL domain-containing protein (putative c-di-GMP-specific phosphodiesterase class I)
MYAAKRAGKGTVEHYRDGMTLPETQHLLLTEPLRSALAGGDVRAVFQPVMDLGSGTVSSFEALARWTYDGRPVPPPQMVAVAARSGLIRDFTASILDQSLHQLSQWNYQVGHDRLQMAVNIPPCHVIDLEFPGLLMEAAARHGISAHQVIVEITEDGLLSGLDAARRVTNELRDAGVSLALDDFGTGYSSLTYLKRFPVEAIKIDRSFVAGLGLDSDDTTIVEAVVNLGHSFGIGVIAEGLETPLQLARLRTIGCDRGQGYLFGRPRPASIVESERVDADS